MVVWISNVLSDDGSLRIQASCANYRFPHDSPARRFMADESAVSAPGLSLIAELELRQDRVLRELDELNQRIEAVLQEFAPKTQPKPDLVLTSLAPLLSEPCLPAAAPELG